MEFLTGAVRMTTTPKALPALPEPSANASKGDVAFFVKWTEAGASVRGTGIELFTAKQMQTYAQQAIADHLASAGGVEVVGYAHEWTVDDQHDFRLRKLESDCLSDVLMDGGICSPLVRQSAHLAALSKEREVADGLARALKEALADLWLQIEPKHGPKAASEYPSIVAAQAALTAHRESRGAASEAKEG